MVAQFRWRRLGDGGNDGEVDDCPNQWGVSTVDRNGCLMQTATVGQMTTTHSTDPTQWSDEDGDGYGDERRIQADDCLNWAGTSNQDGVFGCADGDGDGWADQIDGWDTNPALWSDSDFDGYADQRGDPLESDDCPNEYGKSTIFYLGCPDMDNDGWPDMKDGDTDGDGYMDTTELTANPPSDPLDPLSRHRMQMETLSLTMKNRLRNQPSKIQSFRALSPCWPGLLITLIMAWTLYSSGRESSESMNRCY